MLTKSALNAAYPLAQSLASKGISLSPIANTPLQALVACSLREKAVVDAAPVGSFESFDYNQSLLDSSAAEAPVTGEVEHDSIIERTVAAAAAAVEKNLNQAREVVVPMIKSVVESTTAYMDASAQSSLSPLVVAPYYYKAIWDCPITVELVSKYANFQVEQVQLGKPFPRPADLRAALLTGAGRYDEEVVAFANAVGDDKLEYVWTAVFGGGVAGSLNQVLRVTYDGADNCLLTFLFARRLMDEIPDGLDMELSAYNAYVSSIMAQAGRATARVYAQRESDISVKRLVLAYPANQEGEVIVLGDVYNAWLEAGGAAEILLGASVTDRQVGYQDLLNGKERYLREWQRYYAALQTKASMVRFDSLVAGLRQAMTAIINSDDSNLQLEDRAVYHQRLKERLQHVKPKDIEELWHIARKTVCRVLFPHTNAEMILNAIDAAVKAHPEMDIREAGLWATIDYVAQWVAGLIDVTELSDMGSMRVVEGSALARGAFGG